MASWPRSDGGRGPAPHAGREAMGGAVVYVGAPASLRKEPEPVTLTLSDLSPAVLATEYAVRGPIVARAQELERQGREILYCNIGNPQALGQRPLSYLRQVLALCEYPALVEALPPGHFADDVVATARMVLRESRYGMGSYTESKGLRFVREAVAGFIARRDGIDADPESIYLTDGASKAVQAVLRMVIARPEDGVLIPIPQYPLYSASIALLGARQVGYYLDEGADWKLDRTRLEEAHARALREGTRPRALVVINPGNPTGAVMDEDNVAMAIDFAQRHGLSILADEVYQENVYLTGQRFVSFARVHAAKRVSDIALFSFHSCSKGFLGECGHRGGYVEVRGLDPAVQAELTKLQSVSLCANTVGQVATYLLVSPPPPGAPSHAAYVAERDAILGALRDKARLLGEGLNRIEGITCNVVAGAMYAFPRVTLPPGRSDSDYCMALLEETGICVVPGSGFGQEPGTHHFRTTILPPLEGIERLVARIGAFHRSYR